MLLRYLSLYLRPFPSVVLACAVAVGCKIDSRELQVRDAVDPGSGGETGSGGSSNAGSGGNDGTGSDGSGAASGSGGGPTVTTKDCSDPLLIDDFDSAPTQICSTDGRNGYWFVYSTVSTNVLTPPVGAFAYGGGLNAGGLEFHGTSSAGYDVGVGVSLKNHQNEPTPYDASAYSGVRFMIRSNLSNDLYFNVQLQSRLPVEAGGDCIDSTICNDHPTHLFSTTTEWQEHVVCFYDTASEGYAGGPIVAVKPGELSQLAIRPSVGGDFRFQMDDLYFLPEDDPICGTNNPSVPTGACSASGNGTIFASGTCGTLNTFEADAGSILFASDGRSGDGFLAPDHYLGQAESGTANFGVYADESPAFVGDQLMNFGAEGAIGYPVAFGAGLADGQCYDASAYSGIRFDAKTLSEEEMSIRVSLMTSDIHWYYDCPAEEEQCYDTFGAVLSIGSSWQPYELLWADVAQQGWGYSSAFDPRHLLEILIQDGTLGTPDVPMPAWSVDIDNLSFIGGDDSACNVY